jgi:beta-lactam-binding protein with PASTA domain/tRNA A-37 threonylcarbamoyl transferase component Bud32
MATTTDSIGRVLARRYRIESALGSGTSATVYAAWDVVLQRRVAVKVLHPGLASDGAFLRRFRYEAQSAAALTHPHVLSVYDWGEDDRGPFLVLEYLGGGSLRDLLDNGRRVSLAQAAAMGIEAAEALAYAHGRGFVHRDIKPANLVFDEDGRLRIADFGLARALAEAAMTEPAGASVGTARYAAPEQALGHPVDGRADVYSLGLVLYEAVTGVVPFTADTTVATLMGRVGARIPGHDGLGLLADVLDAATSPDRDERLDAAGLARRLTELASTLPAPETLPLAGAGGLGVAQVGARAFDGTEHGMIPPTGPGAVSQGGPDGTDHDAMALATAVGVADHSAADSGSDKTGSAKTKADRRRWPWIVTIVILVLALAAAGGAYAASRTKFFIPSHRLPTITGITPAAASALVHSDRFHIRLAGTRFSTTVPTGRIIRQIPGAGTTLKQNSTVSVVVSSGPPSVPVPSLAALTGGCPSVVAALAAAHFHPACTPANSTTVKSGTVISWTPTGQATEFSTITVTVSSGPPTETIPSLTGATCAGAGAALQAVGLVAQCTNQYSSTVTSGEVISWTPTGTALEGAIISVIISEGPQPVIVPSIIGDTVSQAVATLTADGLVPASDGPLAGHIFDCTPEPGTSVAPGTTVTIYVK